MKLPQFLKTNLNSENPRCCHETKDGNQCNATPQSGKKYCFFHDPALTKKRAAARRDGGLIRGRKALLPADLAARPLQKAADVAGFLGAIMKQVCLGKMEIHDGTGLAYIALAMMQAMDRAHREQERAAFGVAAKAAVNRLLSDRTAPVDEPSPAEERAGLAARLFSDEKSPFENAHPQIVDERKDPQHSARQHDDLGHNHPQQHDQKPGDDFTSRFFSPSSTPDESRQDPPLQNGAGHEHVESTKSGQQTAESVVPANMAASASQPASSPPKQDHSRQDQSFTGIPGLAPRHTNYVNFVELPGTARWKRERLNPQFLTGASVRAAEMMAETARLRKGRTR